MYLFGRRINFRRLFKEILQIKGVRTMSNKKSDNNENIIKLPPEPTNCCMSGCAKCVWVEYAIELTELFHNQDDKIKKLILEKISDPNMKAFLKTELKSIRK